MSTGLVLLTAFGLVNLVTCLWYGRGLLAEIRARRAPTHRPGIIEDVESRSRGQSWTDYRAVVRFEDAQKRSRQFTTAWSETVLAVGQVVVVGEDVARQRAPRLLLRRDLASHLLRTLIPGALAFAVLLVLARLVAAR